MFKSRRYVRPRIEKAEKELVHFLDEATLLVEALILQHSGTNPDKFRTFDIKKASIDSLNGVLLTLKSIIKKNLHFVDEIIDDIRENSLKIIENNADFTKIISHSMQLNLISDNNDISLYMAPYTESWDLLTAGVQAIIINHVIKSINSEIQRARVAEMISKKL
ncbi:MAG: hypothetical protein FK731_03060 [Asgard group archaeon]|nr:hypothetical protein [Asgard group archaeon]